MPPGRMKLWFIRSPVVFSKNPSTSSRSRNPKIIMVVDPRSMPLVAIHMRCDEIRLSSDKQHADPHGPGRELDPEEGLGGEGEDELVVERRQVVHAGDVGGALVVGELLAVFSMPVCR